MLNRVKKNHLQFYNYLLLGFLVCGLFLSVNTEALVSADGNTSLYEVYGDTYNGNRFVVNAPNANHVSLNRFVNVDVTQPLQIFNIGDGQTPAADVIIIEADNINLASTIQIVGPPSDIVFLKTSPDNLGSFNCNSCEFLNVNRILLATATLAGVDLNAPALITAITNMEVVSGASITVNNLYAPGAFSNDILTQKLVLSGEISLNQNTDKEFTGGFSDNVNGNETIGSGAVTLMFGNLVWNYINRDVVSVLTGVDIISHLTGTIKAPSVRVSSTSSLDSSVNVNTRTDRLAIVLYQGQLKAVKEEVLFETLKADSNLVIRSTLISDETIELRAASNLVTSNTARLEAQEIKMVAGGRIVNTAGITANNIYAAADSIENEGDLSARERISLKSEGFILNQYGGQIEANFVELLSTYGVVRNGAKTPYKSDQGGGAQATVYDDNYVSNLSSVAIGVFYQPNTSVETSGNYVLAPKGNASIVGHTVQIKAAAIENINPYYAFADDDGNVILNISEVNKVRISAEKTLLMVADNYVLNSSAVMHVNDSEGSLALQAPLINNERYRVQLTLGRYEEGSVVTTAEQTLAADVAVYSPPGRIVSMGGFNAKASNALLNNTAYIEIYGNAAIDTPTINNVGVLLTAIDQSNTLFVGFFGAMLQEEVVISTSELDTLFFVQGNVLASQSTGWFHNHQPLDYFVDQTVHYLVAEDLPDIDSAIIDTGVSQYNFVDGTSTSIILEDSYEQIEASSEQLLVIHWVDEQLEIYGVGGGSAVYYAELVESGTIEYSLLEALKRYYEAFVALLTSYTEELKFWN